MRITCRWLSLIATNHLRIRLDCVERLILPVDDSSLLKATIYVAQGDIREVCLKTVRSGDYGVLNG